MSEHHHLHTQPLGLRPEIRDIGMFSESPPDRFVIGLGGVPIRYWSKIAGLVAVRVCPATYQILAGLTFNVTHVPPEFNSPMYLGGSLWGHGQIWCSSIQSLIRESLNSGQFFQTMGLPRLLLRVHLRLVRKHDVQAPAFELVPPRKKPVTLL